jgi:HlyD family secretion protein
MMIGHMKSTGFWRQASVPILLGAFGILLSGCYETQSGMPAGGNITIPAVEALQARLGSLPLTERLTGVVKARNQVAIHPEINAAITEVLVKNGQIVEEGQPLVKLRDTEFREQLKQLEAGYRIAVAQAKQAEAQLAEAQAERRRNERLAEEKLISEAEMEAVRTRVLTAEATLELNNARVEQARANLDEQEQVLSHTVVGAPVAGSVGDRNAEVGMLVNSQTQLFTLGQLDSLRVEVGLTERMLNYIKLGQRVEIFSEDLDAERIRASLSRISPFLNPVTHTTVGEIDITNSGGRLRPGMFVGVDVHYGESKQATVVPLSALYEDPVSGGTGLYVSRTALEEDISGNPENADSRSLIGPVQFDFVPVEVIAKGRLRAGISGVDPGRWVVTIGQDLLSGQSGQARVRIVEWDWVEQLQEMDRQELLRDVMKRQQAEESDAT